jgi:hypothetical protein
VATAGQLAAGPKEPADSTKYGSTGRPDQTGQAGAIGLSRPSKDGEGEGEGLSSFVVGNTEKEQWFDESEADDKMVTQHQHQQQPHQHRYQPKSNTPPPPSSSSSTSSPPKNALIYRIFKGMF